MGLQCGRFIECFILTLALFPGEYACTGPLGNLRAYILKPARVMFGVEHIGNLMGSNEISALFSGCCSCRLEANKLKSLNPLN